VTAPSDCAFPARARADGSGVTLSLRVQPGARREGLEGVTVEADGTPRLRVAIAAPAEGGKANTRLIALLAKRWKLHKSAFTIGAGAAARRKTLLIAGDAESILARISADPGLRPQKDRT
jgi:uncharacterized protein (TIGR00251 family)